MGRQQTEFRSQIAGLEEIINQLRQEQRDLDMENKRLKIEVESERNLSQSFRNFEIPT